MKKIKICIVLFLFMVVPQLSEGLFVSLTRYDDEIDQSLRDEIHVLNRRLVKSFKENAPFSVDDIFSNHLKATPGFKENAAASYEQLSPIIKKLDFVLMTDYYWITKATGPGPYEYLLMTSPGADYSLSGNIGSKKLFASLLRTNGENQDFLLKIIYIQDGSAWKVHNYHFGIYGFGGKSALQWYEESWKDYEKGHLLPAILKASLTTKCLKPVQSFSYAKEKEIVDNIKEMYANFNDKYKFPIRLSGAGGNPKIFSIEPIVIKKKFYPIFNYITTISLDNHAALKKEANSMKHEVEKLFPGISIATENLVFKAFKELPTDPKKIYTNYGTVVETTKGK